MSTFLDDHMVVTRRYFFSLGSVGIVALKSLPILADDARDAASLQEAIGNIESWLTKPADFRDVSRGTPIPHTLPLEKRKEVGLTRDTWKLEVASDPAHPARLRTPLTKEKNTALDFAGLMKIAEQETVRFPKVMTCLNIGCPLGNGIWEGVPLRKVVWLTQPTKNFRRIHYYGYHNDDPKQLFQSSLPIGRVLEDLYDLPPVILCYKLNGQWLSPERGGPVRVVIPESYGFKNIKWLTHMFLSNLASANDTYANGNNDVDSPLKTFCATLLAPGNTPARQPIPITGYAQVGISGLSRVQIWIHNSKDKLPKGDRYYSQAPWRDAQILPPPQAWGGDIEGDRIPGDTLGFDKGQPQTWPMRLTKAHWAILHPGLPAGEYTLRSRTIDEKGNAQPLPRPYAKSGHAAIEQIEFTIG